MLPSDCATSVGPATTRRLGYLIDCGDGPDEDTSPLACDWWQPPPQPGSAAAAARKQNRTALAVERWEASVEAEALRDAARRAWLRP